MDCAARFRESVAAIPGVTGAELNFGAARLTVEGNFDPAAVMAEASRHDLSARLQDGGDAPDPATLRKTRKRTAATVISAVLLVSGWILALLNAPAGTVTASFAAAIAFGGFHAARRGLASLTRLSFDMNVLMTIAVAGAAAIGEWSEGATVAFLFSVSNTLEAYTLDRARRSIRSLIDLTPKEARVRRDGRETVLPAAELVPGDVLIVRPGEKIAADGVISGGGSAVNQAAITGESIPVTKKPGDEVYAGTINERGFMEVSVNRAAEDTTLARIIHLVEDAQAVRAPSQTFVERFAAWYTPLVIGLALGIAVIPPLLLAAPWDPWIYRALALLVVSCPCALVISTPVAVVTAIGNAARHGVLIKGGVFLEEVGKATAVAFDKTGTLSVGRPAVTDVIKAGEGDAEEVLSLAASLERGSEHPLASAIAHHAAKSGARGGEPVEQFISVPGRGVRGYIDGRVVQLGNPEWMAELGIPMETGNEEIERLRAEGKTVVVLAVDGKVSGFIAVTDLLREAAPAAVRALRRLGIAHTVMLTGDNEATAGALARRAGIDEFRAGLLPEDKVKALQELRHRYGKVVMVGDGVNDAPALAAASVGIAMGVGGSDTALETADIVLTADDLDRLPFLMGLSRATLRVIRQNVGFAIGIKLIAILAVFPGWLTLWLAILADMGASVLVTLNAMRLLKPPDLS